jgi:chemotaxis protein histidine kinase CheA
MCQTNQIENGKEGEVIRSQNEVLPVFHLRELLGQSPRETHIANQLAIIVCQIPWERAYRAPRNGKRIALVVDRVEGTEEVLVRNMGRHAGRWFGIAGATELTGGAVALVLDLPRLLSGAPKSAG